MEDKYKNSVVIGYPYGVIAPEFCQSLTKLLLTDRKTEVIVDVIPVGGLYVDANRNTIIDQFLGQYKAEWLWFLDTDIVFGPAVLYTMLKQLDPEKCPILSALYFISEYGRLSFSWYETAFPFRMVEKVVPGLNKIDGCGMGCCFIHRSVLERMREHYKDAWVWFAHEEIPESPELEQKLRPYRQGTSWKPNGYILREDLAFCRRASALGYPIYGHGGVVVGHMKTQCLTLSSFNDKQLIELIKNKEESIGEEEPMNTIK